MLPLAEVTGILGARRQYLAASAGIIGLGDQVQFTHQLLQEYFVARYMKERFSTMWRSLWSAAARDLTAKTDFPSGQDEY